MQKIIDAGIYLASFLTVYGWLRKGGFMVEIILDVLKDAVIDSVKILPLLFLTYLIMESVEHHTSKKLQNAVSKAGKVGPLLGSVLGAIPQCGFSGAAANFYAGGIISLGTLLAIFLSTSDEMLPILISESVSVILIIKILALKIIIGIITGFLVDAITKRKKTIDLNHGIDEICKHEHCNCNNGIFKSAVKHTVQIFGFILAVTIVLNFAIAMIGVDNLSNLILNKPVIGELLSGLIGLIPNCSSSVIITKLYLNNAMGLGALISGLCVNAGVGLLILYKVNRNLKENIKITGILYIAGVVAGIIIGAVGY